MNLKPITWGSCNEAIRERILRSSGPKPKANLASYSDERRRLRVTQTTRCSNGVNPSNPKPRSFREINRKYRFCFRRMRSQFWQPSCSLSIREDGVMARTIEFYVPLNCREKETPQPPPHRRPGKKSAQPVDRSLVEGLSLTAFSGHDGAFEAKVRTVVRRNDGARDTH